MNKANTKATSKTAPVTLKPAPAANANPPAPAKELKTAPAPAKAKPAPKTTAPADAAAKIKLVVTENPHGEKTKDYAKWKLVAANLTVGAALGAGVDRGYLNYAAKRKLIEIG